VFKINSYSEIDIIRKTLQDFGERFIEPLSSIIDKENRYPREIVREMGRYGFLAPTIPEEYNGGGLDLKSGVIVLEELAKYSGSVALISEVQGFLIAETLYRYGSRDIKENILPKIASGEVIGSFALSEPCCGSDAAAIETYAERSGDHWFINGVKTWITQGLYADYYLLFARVGSKKERHKNIALFLVKKDECIKTSPIEVMGFRGTGTAEVVLNNCSVDSDSLMAPPGEGFKIAMEVLNIGRVAISALGVGLAERSLAEAYRFLRDRKAFDKTIIEFQYIQFLLSDLYTLLETSRALVYKAAETISKEDVKEKIPLIAAVTKNFVAPTAVYIVGEALRLLGGYGYSKESVVERIYRDVKLLEIGEGTNEVQKMVISKHLLNKGLQKIFS
jgi:alkylation response protein AidB-like acyl-CoA dehydrogenase